MSQALETWRKKLDYLEEQEAIVADPAQLFSLAQQIEDAKARIAELETTTGSPRPIVQVPFHADISRIIKYAPAELIGREEETKLLSDAWDKTVRGEPKRPHILTFVALGGEGKTSLVAKWAAEMAHRDWPGCDAVFAWSFYSQGTREQTAASSDIFLKAALTAFGDPAMADSAQGAFDKGRRLAQFVGERQALLILDGLEPLQYAPTSPTPGELKDQGIAALLKALAATNHGLCVVTTRYAIPDLRAYWQGTAPVHELLRLSTAAGVKLLRTLGVKTGSQAEFEKLVEDVDGHALTLQILGGFLTRAFQGDIRRRDRIDLEKADARIQGGHAFRAMEAYVKWLENDSDEARREVALLKLLGLFDRPATKDCVDAMRHEPAIPELTEPLVGLAEDDWEYSLSSLHNAKLLTVNREEDSGKLIALDAHPLLREYFARRMRQQQPEAWRAAHRRLYEHLCKTTSDKDAPTLDDLQPLYQAVAHGCQAGMYEAAWSEVYVKRINRSGGQFYSLHMLGGYGSDLGAVACFFESPWCRLAETLSPQAKTSLLGTAAFELRGLGRLAEATEPMRASLEMCAKLNAWNGAAKVASNLSELEMALGEVARAVEDAAQSVSYADQSGDEFQRMTKRARLADALHQAGRRAEAETYFREAEQIHAGRESDYPLYGLAGFQYCELLLTDAERAAWQRMLGSSGVCAEMDLQEPFASAQMPLTGEQHNKVPSDEEASASACDAYATQLQSCRAVSERAAQTLKAAKRNRVLLDIARDNLTLGRAKLYAALLSSDSSCSFISPSFDFIDFVLADLRRAQEQHTLIAGLLTCAWLRSLIGAHTGSENAQSDLDEAWEIAERGPMRLFLADIHLHRARLFFRELPYPWTSPKADIAEARRLIEKHGYCRRQEELEDAEAALAR
jgi:tetratricopeptide (TPR) repeat protein